MKNMDSFRKSKSKNKSGVKGKDLTVFVRFGGLDLKTQKGYVENTEAYHTPPAPRGFYAFPKVAQEWRIGPYYATQPSIMPKYPELSENASHVEKEKYRKLVNKYEKEIKKRYREIRKEFKKTTGSIWHHLGEYCRQYEIIDSHHSWVKTSIETWQKAFSKASLNLRYGDGFKFGYGRGEHSINKAPGIFGYYYKNFLEVFFDEKV